MTQRRLLPLLALLLPFVCPTLAGAQGAPLPRFQVGVASPAVFSVLRATGAVTSSGCFSSPALGPICPIDLTLTGVSPGTYPDDGAHVPQMTVDAQGRITAITQIPVVGGGGGATPTSTAATPTPTPTATMTSGTCPVGPPQQFCKGLNADGSCQCSLLPTPTPTLSPTPAPTATATQGVCPLNPDGTGPGQIGEDPSGRPICAATSTATRTATPTITSTPGPSPTSTPCLGDTWSRGDGSCETLDLGTDTAGGYAGSSSEGGPATTALALNANPTDCTTSHTFATAIDAAGNLTCAALTDADVPNNITVDLATAATALAANPTDCSAHQFATTIDAGGNLTCAALTDADVPNSITIDLATAATALASDPTDCASNRYATTIDSGGNLTCSQVSLTAGVTGVLPVANGGTGASSLTDLIALGSQTTGNYAAGDAEAGGATKVTGSVTLPATCTEKDVYQDTDSGGTEFYICTATNTWTKTIAATDNVATATALAADPSDCAANRYGTAIDAGGNLTCSQVSLTAGVTGTLPIGNGGTGNTSGQAADLACTDCVALGTETTGGYAGSASEAGPATTALALNADPTDSASNRYATTIDSGGNLTCAQVSLTAGVTGVLPVANGGTGASSLTDLIALGSQTTGNYVQDVAAGTGMSVTGAAGEGATKTVVLADTSVTPGTYGRGTSIPVLAVDQQGRITTLSTVAIGAAPAAFTYHQDTAGTDSATCGDETHPCATLTGVNGVWTKINANNDNGFATCSTNISLGCGRCSTHTTTQCNENADCPGVETCTATDSVCPASGTCTGTAKVYVAFLGGGDVPESVTGANEVPSPGSVYIKGTGQFSSRLYSLSSAGTYEYTSRTNVGIYDVTVTAISNAPPVFTQHDGNTMSIERSGMITTGTGGALVWVGNHACTANVTPFACCSGPGAGTCGHGNGTLTTRNTFMWLYSNASGSALDLSVAPTVCANDYTRSCLVDGNCSSSTCSVAGSSDIDIGNALVQLGNAGSAAGRCIDLHYEGCGSYFNQLFDQITCKTSTGTTSLAVTHGIRTTQESCSSSSPSTLKNLGIATFKNITIQGTIGYDPPNVSMEIGANTQAWFLGPMNYDACRRIINGNVQLSHDPGKPMCIGGTDGGNNCTVNADCTSNVCQRRGGFAAGQTNLGDIDCDAPREPNHCSTTTSRYCWSSLFCAGGTNAGAVCTTDSECPSSSCSGDCPSGETCVAPTVTNNCRPGEHWFAKTLGKYQWCGTTAGTIKSQVDDPLYITTPTATPTLTPTPLAGQTATFTPSPTVTATPPPDGLVVGNSIKTFQDVKIIGGIIPLAGETDGAGLFTIKDKSGVVVAKLIDTAALGGRCEWTAVRAAVSLRNSTGRVFDCNGADCRVTQDPAAALSVVTRQYVDKALLTGNTTGPANDTVSSAPVRGGMIVGNTTPKWAQVAIGAAGTLWQSNGTDPSWGTAATTGSLLMGSSTPAWTNLAAGSAATLLQMSGGLPTWLTAASRGGLLIGNSTPAWATLAVGAKGTYPISDGTDLAFGGGASSYLYLPVGTANMFGLVRSTQTGAANSTMRVMRVVPMVSLLSAVKMAWSITSAGTSTPSCGIAIYPDTDGGSAIATTGSVTTSGSSVNTKTSITAFTLVAGTTYRLGWCCYSQGGGTTPTYEAMATPSFGANPVNTFVTSMATAGACTSGAPPTTTGALSAAANFDPILVKVSAE